MRVFSFRNGSKKIWEYGSFFEILGGGGGRRSAGVNAGACGADRRPK
jgi:hypothetical protein